MAARASARRPSWVVWLPLGLAWLALAVRVTGLTAQSLWRDEVDTLLFATRPLSQSLAMFRQGGQNGPLFFLALRPWLGLAGRSEFALRFPSALAGALAVPVCYLLVSRLAGRRAGALAALLSAVAPYLVWYGQEAKMYAALTLLVPLALWLVVEAAARGRWWRWALLYAVTTAAIYTHLLAALVVPVQVLWLLILPAPRGRPRRWRDVALYLAALCLPYLPLAVWQAEMWFSTFETGHRFVPLGDILVVLADVFSLGVQPGGFFPLLPFVLSLVAAVLLYPLAFKPRTRHSTPKETIRVHPRSSASHSQYSLCQPLPLLLIWLGLPPLLVYGISLGMPIFTERYLIWAMPAFLALVALGIIALLRAWRPLGLLALAAILALDIGGLIEQARRPIKSDFRAAAAYVVGHIRPDDLLIYQIPHVRYVFTYYFSGRGDPDDTARPWLDGPDTNRGMSEAEVDAWLAAGVGPAPAAWLIASEVEARDARGLTQQWLAAHGAVDLHADFERVAVTRYNLQRPQ